MITKTDQHSGPVVVDFHGGWVYVKCPAGHLVMARQLDPSWAGSWFEAKVGQHAFDGSWIVTCSGALSEEDDPIEAAAS